MQDAHGQGLLNVIYTHVAYQVSYKYHTNTVLLYFLVMQNPNVAYSWGYYKCLQLHFGRHCGAWLQELSAPDTVLLVYTLSRVR